MARTSPLRQTAHEWARETIRRAILNGEIPGGTRLVQAGLAAELRISTTPIREALRDLAVEGLIQFDPHRGAIVQELSGEELKEVYQIRRMLEPLAMRQAVAKIDEQVLVHLKGLCDRMVEEPNSGAWVEFNRTFHMAIYESGASPRLAAIIRSLQDASAMYVSASLSAVEGIREQANRDHARILEALEARDADAAVEALMDHLMIPLQALQSRLDGRAPSRPVVTD